ncbi:MAG TPA: four helix bundle protein [Gemmatimonadales bacterium]|nr:four helix bundle protein [Gemmatimonadales bacterium]
MGKFQDLDVWKSSQELAVTTYRLTATFPAQERYGLTAQMRRAAVSVVSNIAEGTGRGTDAQFAAFLRIARGSLHELECQALLASELGFSDSGNMNELVERSHSTGRLLQGLLRSLHTER